MNENIEQYALRIAMPLAAFVFSFLGTLLMANLGQRFGWLSRPRATRWHTKPVALHGGVGFCLPFLAIAFLSLCFFFEEPWDFFVAAGRTSPAVKLAYASIIGAFFMLLCGLWDDLRQMSPVTKIICQFAATSFFVSAGGVFTLTHQPIIDLMLTFLWFVGITNAMNMLDNMDGLASGVALLACCGVAILTEKSGSHSPANMIATLFAASLLGFWLHNRAPASIFMGDSGSLSMGYMLAALSMPTAFNQQLGLPPPSFFEYSSLLHLFIPVAILATPIFDTTFVTLTRILTARKVHHGGCDHSSHRLVRLGFSEARTALILSFISSVGVCIAVLIQRFPDQSMPIFGIFSLMIICFGGYLNHVPVREKSDNGQLPISTKLLTGFLVKRSAAQVIVDTVLIMTCFWGAHLLRFDFNIIAPVRDAMLQSMPLVIACCLLGLRFAGAYGGTWRLASASDLPSFALGVVIGVTLSLSAVTLLSRFGEGYSRSAYITFGFLLFLAITLVRQSFNVLDTIIKRKTLANKDICLQPVIIYGAGKGGLILLEETLFNETFTGVCVLGFTDDDVTLHGHKIGGLPIKEKSRWQRELASAPEIWISSAAISNEKGVTFAALWEPRARVRRQSFTLHSVSE
jgi:UDP-GlcNAc:undecaprenyl-phosphate GlcNAc-1-phosphate transferase